MKRTDSKNTPAGTEPRPPRVTRRAPIDSRKLALARTFRKKPTPSEALAWKLLRGRGILGLKFRRQQVVAGFVLDFYCAELRIAIELDGPVHDDPAQAEYDALRSLALDRFAIRVLRLENDQVSELSLRTLLAGYLKPSEPPSL